LRFGHEQYIEVESNRLELKYFKTLLKEISTQCKRCISATLQKIMSGRAA
jgi:hypothetical protein